jgi:hypothetical protein
MAKINKKKISAMKWIKKNFIFKYFITFYFYIS